MAYAVHICTVRLQGLTRKPLTGSMPRRSLEQVKDADLLQLIEGAEEERKATTVQTDQTDSLGSAQIQEPSPNEVMVGS